MKEFSNVVTFKGAPLTLVGERSVEVGDEAIDIVDENGKIKYKQVVKEVSSEPNYDEVLANL
ncbi:MAG: hypothetical protein ACP5PT_02445 [Brevinematia bacterium]|jgi:peroxiredoxin